MGPSLWLWLRRWLRLRLRLRLRPWLWLWLWPRLCSVRVESRALVWAEGAVTEVKCKATGGIIDGNEEGARARCGADTAAKVNIKVGAWD